MNSLILLFTAGVLYILGYRLYGKFLSRTFGLDEKNQTPASEINDGVDFVPREELVDVVWASLFIYLRSGTYCGACLSMRLLGMGCFFCLDCGRRDLDGGSLRFFRARHEC